MSMFTQPDHPVAQVAAPPPVAPAHQAYPLALRDEVEAYLADLRFSMEPATEGLHEAMRYSLLAGGKRVRPVLVLATARALAMRPRDVLPIAAAIELIHTFSLIHDDLPAMDDDDLRRGRPTSHRVFGDGVAILAGDALFAEAFALVLTRLDGPPDRVLAASRVIARAVATQGLAGGQYIDITGGARDEAGILQMHRLKTGALLEASVQSVVQLARPEPPIAAALAGYAAELGLMFQIVDDLLDVQGTTAALGKPQGSDERNGRSSLAADGRTDRACDLADACLARIVGWLSRLDADGSELHAIATFVRRRVG
jgi:geranylgeranyl diphosphate synthase type II